MPLCKKRFVLLLVSLGLSCCVFAAPALADENPIVKAESAQTAQVHPITDHTQDVTEAVCGSNESSALSETTAANLPLNETTPPVTDLSQTTDPLKPSKNATVTDENTEPADPVAPPQDPADGSNTLPPENDLGNEELVDPPGDEAEEKPQPPTDEPASSSTQATLTTDHVIYLGGYEDHTVRPDQEVTRAEAAAIVYRLIENPESGTGSCSYTDVHDGDWFAFNVRALCRLGLFDDGTLFRPNDAITRAEMVDLLVRFAPAVTPTVSFSDVASDYWACEQIGIAATLGWVGGYEDGTFRPENGLTRAEACSVMNRVTGRSGDARQTEKLLGLGLYTDMTASHWAAGTICEASVAHTTETVGKGESWSGVALENYVFNPGVHDISGILYSVDAHGKLALNRSVGAYWADGEGALTQVASSYQQSYVPYISQIDGIGAWMGCEPISALMGLKTYGYALDVTPTAFLSALPITSSDPAQGFVGSPYYSDGRYSSIDPIPLALFCNRYTNGAEVASDITGASILAVRRELLAGNMIVAYQTFSFAPAKYANFVINGTLQARVSNNHVRLVYGYDPARGYLVSDPYNLTCPGQSYQYWVDAATFERAWNEREMGMAMRA